VWDPLGRRLLTVQLHDHQGQAAQGGVPLLVIDAWEHAYYLQYRADLAAYLEALWRLWNWRDVAARLKAVERIDLGTGYTLNGERHPR
jgi:superoxide dismutase, Fe-Mn family